MVTRAAELAYMMQAQERLMTTNDIAAGTGNMKKGAHSRHFRRLKRQARGPVRHTDDETITRRAPAATADDLRAMGVEVVEVKVGDDG